MTTERIHYKFRKWGSSSLFIFSLLVLVGAALLLNILQKPLGNIAETMLGGSSEGFDLERISEHIATTGYLATSVMFLCGLWLPKLKHIIQGTALLLVMMATFTLVLMIDYSVNFVSALMTPLLFVVLIPAVVGFASFFGIFGIDRILGPHSHNSG